MVEKLRKKSGLTQAELAQKIGASQSVIARLERGNDTRTPSRSLLSKVADSCNAILEFGFSYKKVS